MIDDKTPPPEKTVDAQHAMHDGFNAQPPPYYPSLGNNPPVNVFYQTGAGNNAVDEKAPPAAPGQPSASASMPANQDWTVLPTSEFLSAGGRLIADRDVPASQPPPQGGRGLLSMLGQAMSRPSPPPTTGNAAVIPPAFSRPVPNIPQGSLQWFAPLLIQSRSTRIIDGFPLVFPAPEMQSHDVTPADWQAFLMHIDSMLQSGVVSDPAGHGHAAQMLVGQWSAAFFQPRRLRVTLRPEIPTTGHSGVPNRSGRGDIDRSDARSISSVSSTSTSSSSSSSSDDSHHDKSKSKGKKSGHHGHAAPPPMAGGPIPQAAGSASMMSYRMERRMERDQRKTERRAQRDERKAQRRARKMERRERKRERRLQRKENKAMRKGKFVPERALASGRWELIIECI